MFSPELSHHLLYASQLFSNLICIGSLSTINESVSKLPP